MVKMFKDQLNRTIEIAFPPRRIISLVPSQSELLAFLKLEEEVVGITKFCVHPADWFQKKARIGGTKNLNIHQIRALKPDLIIANKEENEMQQVMQLTMEFPVWVSDVNNLDDALDMITRIGELANRSEKAQELTRALSSKFQKNQEAFSGKTCAYLIWSDPLMTIGSNTFIHDMLIRSGVHNVFEHRVDSRYPVISENELIDAQPAFVLLSSEPFPFNERHIQRFQSILPRSVIQLVDGEMYSWYGSRLLFFDSTRIRQSSS